MMSSPSQNLTQFLADQHRRCDGSHSNITSYSGGNYRLYNKSDFEEFISLYEHSIITNDHFHYLNERSNPRAFDQSENCRFYMDLDMKLDEQLSEEDENEMVNILTNACIVHTRNIIAMNMNCILPTENHMYLLKTKQRPVANGKWKIGFHPIFANIITMNFCDARTFADIITQSFNRASLLGRTDWHDIIDMQVYGNGLRLPFVSKCSICNDCKRNRQKMFSCMTCRMSGMIYDPDGKYVLDRVVDFNNEVPEYSKLYRDIMRKVMIGQLAVNVAKQMNDAQELISFNENPKYIPEWYIPRKEIVKQNKDHISNQIYKESKKSSNMIAMTGDMPEFSAIKAYINNCWSDVYPKLNITRIFKCTNPKNNAITYRVSTLNKYCQNKRSEHSKSTIYFNISIRGSHQRCWCSNNVLHGKEGNLKKCSAYFSETRPIDYNTKQIIFPQFKQMITDRQEMLKMSLIKDEKLLYSSKWLSFIDTRLEKLAK